MKKNNIVEYIVKKVASDESISKTKWSENKCILIQANINYLSWTFTSQAENKCTSLHNTCDSIQHLLTANRYGIEHGEKRAKGKTARRKGQGMKKRFFWFSLRVSHALIRKICPFCEGALDLQRVWNILTTTRKHFTGGPFWFVQYPGGDRFYDSPPASGNSIEIRRGGSHMGGAWKNL